MEGSSSVVLRRVLGRGAYSDGKPLAFVELQPLTGRTHQLRVHCAAMGWPIVGDAIYGNAPRHSGAPLHLHARDVVVPLYKNREPIRQVSMIRLAFEVRKRLCGTTPAKDFDPLVPGSGHLISLFTSGLPF